VLDARGGPSPASPHTATDTDADTDTDSDADADADADTAAEPAESTNTYVGLHAGPLQCSVDHGDYAVPKSLQQDNDNDLYDNASCSTDDTVVAIDVNLLTAPLPELRTPALTPRTSSSSITGNISPNAYSAPH